MCMARTAGFSEISNRSKHGCGTASTVLHLTDRKSALSLCWCARRRRNARLCADMWESGSLTRTIELTPGALVRLCLVSASTEMAR